MAQLQGGWVHRQLGVCCAGRAGQGRGGALGRTGQVEDSLVGHVQQTVQ
jgi:hypothetical protein